MGPFSSLPSRPLKDTVLKPKQPLQLCSVVRRNVSSCYILYSRYSNSPYSQGAESHVVTLLLLPQCTGSRVGDQVGFREDNPMAWIWQDTVHPIQPSAVMKQQDLRPGFITPVFGFCRRQSPSAASLFLDVKLLQRKGHNLTKLARSAPQNSKFQALVICKPSHDSSSVHEGKDSFPVKVPNNHHKPKKPLHAYGSQRDQPG